MQVLRIFWNTHAKATPALRATTRHKSTAATKHAHGLVFLGYAVERGDASWCLFVGPDASPRGSAVYAQGQGTGRRELLDDTTSAAVQVFNGETRYGDEQRAEHVQQLLAGNEAQRGAVDLVVMRGMMQRFAYSQLETIIGQHVATQGD